MNATSMSLFLVLVLSVPFVYIVKAEDEISPEAMEIYLENSDVDVALLAYEKKVYDQLVLLLSKTSPESGVASNLPSTNDAVQSLSYEGKAAEYQMAGKVPFLAKVIIDFYVIYYACVASNKVGDHKYDAKNFNTSSSYDLDDLRSDRRKRLMSLFTECEDKLIAETAMGEFCKDNFSILKQHAQGQLSTEDCDDQLIHKIGPKNATENLGPYLLDNRP